MSSPSPYEHNYKRRDSQICCTPSEFHDEFQIIVSERSAFVWVNCHPNLFCPINADVKISACSPTVILVHIYDLLLITSLHRYAHDSTLLQHISTFRYITFDLPRISYELYFVSYKNQLFLFSYKKRIPITVPFRGGSGE